MYIQRDIPLAQYTTFKTGGSADFFCEIKTKEDLRECFDFIKKEGQAYFCLGNGSNLLINDLGFRGVVLKFLNIDTAWDGVVSSSGAGAMLTNLINEAKKHSLGGMEWAFGIPATLGGAVRNNVGAFGSDLAGLVESVEFFDPGKMEFKIIDKSGCGFSYHGSIFQEKPNWIIWRVNLRWGEKNADTIGKEIQNFFGQRKDRQPLEKPSAGSFFQNPSLGSLTAENRGNIVEDFIKKELAKCSPDQDKNKVEKAIRTRIEQINVLPAAYLIEDTGLKGRSIGGAQVSEKHANFIINKGSAKTEDVIILASMVKQKVRTNFGIQLHEEVEYVGF